ncbi:MAG: ZIP family metal transporter [Lachnospiraceae bacterium]
MAQSWNRLFLGFAAGVMIAAAIWSLLIPAIDKAIELGKIGWIPAAGGFLGGGVFFLILDGVIPYLRRKVGGELQCCDNSNWMLMTAVTLHNVPEGMAVGLACALASLDLGTDARVLSAISLAVGIGIQNFPEGAAISLPFYQKGYPKLKAFIMGVASGAVEPIACILTAMAASLIEPILPWMLSFAAGAMMFVVAEELIPESYGQKETYMGTMGLMLGFTLMMVLDVALS